MKRLTLLIYFFSLIGKKCECFSPLYSLPPSGDGQFWETASSSLQVQQLLQGLASGPLKGERVTIIIPEDLSFLANEFLDLPETPISVISLPKEKPESIAATLNNTNIITFDLEGHAPQTSMVIDEHGTVIFDKYTSVAIAIVDSDDLQWWPLWLPVRQWSSGAALLVSIKAPRNKNSYFQVPFMQATWAAFICPRKLQTENEIDPMYQVWTTLPFATKNKSISLGVWKPEAFKLWSDLFIDRFKDMGEKTMTASGFAIDVPLLHADIDGGPPKGLCYKIFDALSKWLGFQYSIYLTRDITFHIIEESVKRGENDLFLNFASLTPERYEHFSLTVPYLYEGFGLILEVPPPLPRWQNIIHPFTWQVWTATLVTLLLTALTFHMLNYKQEQSFVTNLITVSQGLLSNPLDIVPADWRIRYFLLLWWILSWLLELSYFCNLIAVLTIPAFPTKIQAATELADSNYRVCMLDYGEFVAEAMPASTHPTLAALGAKMDMVPLLEHLENAGEEGCVELVLKGTHAHLETYSYIIYLYSKLGHNPKIYPMKEQLYSNYLAFPVQKDAPWKHKFDVGIERLFEGGLINRWMGQARKESLSGPIEEATISKNEAKSLTVGHLQGPFLILIIGNIVAAVVILGEMLINCRKDDSVFD